MSRTFRALLLALSLLVASSSAALCEQEREPAGEKALEAVEAESKERIEEKKPNETSQPAAKSETPTEKPASKKAAQESIATQKAKGRFQVGEDEKPIPTRQGYIETHDGLMLRFTLGFGAGNLKGRDSHTPNEKEAQRIGDWTRCTNMDLTTVNVDFGFSIGYGVIANLVLHGNLFLKGGYTYLENAVYPYANAGASVMGGAGGGLTYYFMPKNVFVTANVFFAGVSIANVHDEIEENWRELASTEDEARREQIEEENKELDPIQMDEGPGVVAELLLGKEWWISDQWAMGIAGKFAYGFFSGGDGNWVDLFGGLLWTTTYQ